MRKIMHQKRYITLWPLFLGICLMLSSSCQRPVNEFQRDIFSFGTLINVHLYDIQKTEADQLFSQLEADFQRLHDAWSPWVPGSLSRVNQLIATGGWFTAGPSIYELIQASLPISENTQQLFNPAIGKLINLWQFHRHDDPDIQPPTADAINAFLKQAPSLRDLELNGLRMRSNNPAVSLNFGAFAKGFAIDKAIAFLKSRGVRHAIVNAGGDLKAIGSHGNRPSTLR